MKLHELIKTNDWQSVELILGSVYPDQQKSIEAYAEVFQNLRQMTPTEIDIQIVLEQCYDNKTGDESYVHVSGREPFPDESNPTGILAIEFVPWSQWLGMTIDRGTLKEFNQLEIISHCLYEMTFMGFDEEEIQGQLDDLENTVEDLKNMSEKEKRAKTKSLDDLLKELDEE